MNSSQSYSKAISNKNSSHIYLPHTTLLFLFFFVAGSLLANQPEKCKLVKTEYPVLPHVIIDTEEVRNAGSFLNVRRTDNDNEVLYISKSVVRGITECHWTSRFIWNLKIPEVIQTGT